jgi:pyruvate,water dikinase
VAGTDTKAALGLAYLAFRDLTTSNDELLEIIADIEQKLEGDAYFGMAYVRFRAVASATHVYRMIICLDKLSSRRYQELHLVFGSIQRRIDATLANSRPPEVSSGPFVYRLVAIGAGDVARVGGKAANVGDLLNRVGLPVPGGFAVSTSAFAAFLANDQLGEEIRARQVSLDPADLDRLTDISEDLQRLILARPVPAPVADAILTAYDHLAAGLGHAPRVAMRSSAVGEDGESSFAGQYVTVLNVARDHLVDAYREVLAGLYTPRALFYRSIHGIPDDDVPMGALCMVMIDAVASGVACSLDPSHPESDTLVITGAWGLGVATVGGRVSPDIWQVSKTGDPGIIATRPGWKDTTAEACAEGGVAWLATPPTAASALCLSEAQVLDLARLLVAAESHFGGPQELEWALDRGRRFFVLQCRPLQIAREAATAGADVESGVDGHRVLFTGVGASTGCASGPVVHLAESDDASRFPAGGVLVARYSSPQYVKIMGRASAIITDVGAATGHMASLAREFGVPAVLDSRVATATLAEQQIVTVDAKHGTVYDGRVDRLLTLAPRRPGRTMKETPVYDLLRRVADAIVPLNLTDPRDPAFRPGTCRTFHDIARFVHEKAFEEMFRMSDRVADVTHKAVRLDERLPFALYLIDIGGGLHHPAGASSVSRAEVLSAPMQALLAGMTNPALRWWEPRGISPSGFLSVATQALLNPQYDGAQRQLGDRSYAIVAEAYCNFSSRIGYHFAAVDAYCSDFPTRNYVSFRFKGGAADDARRAKRCELIDGILTRLDFRIERTGDLVNARVRKFPREATAERLDQIGRLIVATRQLDMRMAARSSVGWYVDAFLAGNYLFEEEAHPRRVRGRAGS